MCLHMLNISCKKVHISQGFMDLLYKRKPQKENEETAGI